MSFTNTGGSHRSAGNPFVVKDCPREVEDCLCLARRDDLGDGQHRGAGAEGEDGSGDEELDAGVGHDGLRRGGE